MKIKKMNDEECLNKFIEFLQTRIKITTKFMIDDDQNITHQFLIISCGDLVSVSEPEPLDVVLRPALAKELGLVIN